MPGITQAFLFLLNPNMKLAGIFYDNNRFSITKSLLANLLARSGLCYISLWIDRFFNGHDIINKINGGI